MNFKIYRFDISAESEWVIARTAFEAIKLYCDVTGYTIGDFENEDDIFEVPESDWDTHKVMHDDGEPDKTYREMMEGVVAPCYGWSTVF